MIPRRTSTLCAASATDSEQIEWWLIDLGPDRPVPGFWRSARHSVRPHPAGLMSWSGAVADALEVFRNALRDGASDWPVGSALAERYAERRIARKLGVALLPADLVDHLVSPRDSRTMPFLCIHAAGRFTDIPWEALAVDDRDTGLVEVAQVRVIPPPAGAPPAQAPIDGETSSVIVDPNSGPIPSSAKWLTVVTFRSR